MKSKKNILLSIVVTVLVFSSFFIGKYSGEKQAKQNYTSKLRDFALSTYDNIKNEFGIVNENDKKIGYIQFYKDLGFCIIDENEVNTIRVY